MDAQKILDKRIANSLISWRARAFDRFKANCRICEIPLRPADARFTKLDTKSFFCNECWEDRILPSLKKARHIADAVEKDVAGLLYALVFHTDLLKDDSDFAELGKYVAGVMKSYMSRLIEAGFEPDAVMGYWPISLFKRLTGIDLPDDWPNRLFAASVIDDVVRFHAAKGLFIYEPAKAYWEKSFRDAPAAYALRKEPLRKVQPEELLELLRQERH